MTCAICIHKLGCGHGEGVREGDRRREGGREGRVSGEKCRCDGEREGTIDDAAVTRRTT